MRAEADRLPERWSGMVRVMITKVGDTGNAACAAVSIAPNSARCSPCNPAADVEESGWLGANVVILHGSVAQCCHVAPSLYASQTGLIRALRCLCVNEVPCAIYLVP